MNGTFYGVGVGPGDPRLMTYLAVDTIRFCPVIAAPTEKGELGIAYRIARGMIPDLGEKTCIGYHIPMTKDASLLEAAYQSAAAAITAELRKGQDVACLTLGDPTVYSSYIYLQRRIAALGFSTQIVSGIPSFCAVSARLGDSLAERAEQLHIIPSSYKIETALELPGTKVFMKAGARMQDLKSALQKKKAACRMVENCGMPEEHIYEDVDDIPEEASYYSIVIVK